MKKSKYEKLMDLHYHDMLDLNRRFIQTMSRPRVLPEAVTNFKRAPLSKKQLKALEKGRKKLAANRSKVIQI